MNNINATTDLMKHLTVQPLCADRDTTAGEIAVLMDGVPKNNLDVVSWPLYPYRPLVRFAMAFEGPRLFIKYFVEENYVRAVYSKPNEPVYRDSCVEFFVAFGDEEEYYNFEFNCAGACLLGYGSERARRELASAEVIGSIQHLAVIKPARNGNANIGWELTIVIPAEAFHHHTIHTFSGKRLRANFYKCGDDLPERCYLSWNKVVSDEPDFHLSEYFGQIECAKQANYKIIE